MSLGRGRFDRSGHSPSLLILVLFRPAKLGQNMWLDLAIDSDALLHKALNLHKLRIGSLPMTTKAKLIPLSKGNERGGQPAQRVTLTEGPCDSCVTSFLRVSIQL